ncbi:exonuclease/endonuclease/phosphatase family protein [Winogradskyella vidalii]|uniref:endonuclease/exonuclease/phosphatase family protein n=1 Tax=Winogradskyella vidalii TaxID=2615024 RepID=UPI0015CC6DED|nr:endonuclease/exonuclease/phosphatase family protein [Winogradskyella vidalii]
MKIATFNIQNLFHRDKSLLDKPFGKNLNDWIQELDTLMLHPSKSVNQQDRIKELSFLIGFEKPSPRPYAILRRKSGFLYMKGLSHSLENKANDITNWNGWVELQTIPIQSKATDHKARVIADVNPDILLLQEIEDRASFEEFNQLILPKYGCQPYPQSFVIQGNDMNSLEMGIALREGYHLESVRTLNINTTLNDDGKNLIVYEITTPSKKTIWLLNVYLIKDKQDKTYSDTIRKNQATRIAAIYNQLKAEGKTNIIVAGTFNAPPYCNTLSPIIQDTDLKDITKHGSFEVDTDKGNDANYFRLGAYRMGVNIKQNDYMLFSPALFDKITSCGLNRKAMWPEKQPQWSIYKSVSNKNMAASAHPLVWGEMLEM